MWFRLAADFLVLAHLAFILFVCLGGLWVMRHPRCAWLHGPAALWGAFIEFSGWICPLTPLEWRLRELAGEVGYRGGFAEHYLLPLLYPPGLTAPAQWVLGSFVVVANGIFYSIAWRRWRRRSSSLTGIPLATVETPQDRPRRPRDVERGCRK